MKNRMLGILITAVCLLAAMACYFAGIETGAVLLLMLGVAFEGYFWFRVIGFKRSRPKI